MTEQNKNTISGVTCDAKNCIHHAADDRCTANGIKVGYCSSCNCSETACTTFRQKD